MLARFLSGATAAGGIKYVGGYVEGFLGTTSNITVSLTSLSGGLASLPSADDLVIVYFATGTEKENRNLNVSGYTELIEMPEGDIKYYTNLVVAYKFMGSTPDTSFTLTGGTVSTADAGVVAVQVWRGVNISTPLDVVISTASKSQSVLCDPPPITPVTQGAIIVSGGAGAHGKGTRTYSSSNLTGFISVGANDTSDATVGLGYHEWTSGTFNPAQFTFNEDDSLDFSSAAVTLALRPA